MYLFIFVTYCDFKTEILILIPYLSAIVTLAIYYLFIKCL